MGILRNQEKTSMAGELRMGMWQMMRAEKEAETRPWPARVKDFGLYTLTSSGFSLDSPGEHFRNADSDPTPEQLNPDFWK